jgi:glycine dehydrogenase
VAKGHALGANLRIAWDSYICISLDETTTRADVELVWRIFAKPGQAIPAVRASRKASSR